MSIVIFACVHNAGRSQMAAAFFNALANSEKAQAFSAGTQPGSCIHSEVLAAMREVGLDLRGIAPQPLTRELAAPATLLITMGCGEACPNLPGVEREDWPMEDPKGKSPERVREIRNEVEQRVRALIQARGWD